MSKLDNFVGIKFYCPYALAYGSYGIQIREKMLEFSSAVLPTLSRCVIYVYLQRYSN